ncbi:SHOCT domain-containing protein [Methylobacterium sp. J-078]|uniref:SHOCT domain-containing protein n=1 Tax=Methylobacterium sp. J-078 TaxID=2836657 RepID=UPI001FB8E5D8|nr:SHOCT domain-containing protein [Methylobacterium sp. J-078]MCJ2044800.1 SHOCT domain-containing protein [Methylobacterium sp. J-078]
MTEHPNALQSIAERHGFSLDAVRHLVRSLEAGQGRMAQFNHPDLGGLGQWTSGGMTMIGDMFNTGLKARVSALCADLSSSLPAAGWVEPRTAAAGWPAEWGPPATSGSQNGMRYAYFPARHRLAVETEGRVALYDTEGHDISGVAQQQGGMSSLRFSGRDGAVELASLKRVDEVGAAAEGTPDAPPEVQPFEPAPAEPGPFEPGSHAPPATPAILASAGRADEILGTIERLADLHRRGILDQTEFASKKAELLARL